MNKESKVGGIFAIVIGIILIIMGACLYSLGEELLLIALAGGSISIGCGVYSYHKASKQEEEAQKEKERQEAADKKREIELQEKIRRAEELHETLCRNGYTFEDNCVYKVPTGYLINSWRTVKTLVRGTFYREFLDWSEVHKGDEVTVKHEPQFNHPESTAVYCNYEHIGYLKEDMATEFVEKYGEHFEFKGTITDRNKSEQKIFINFSVPEFIVDRNIT